MPPPVPSPAIIQVPPFLTFAPSRGFMPPKERGVPEYGTSVQASFAGLPCDGYAYFKVNRRSQLHFLLECLRIWCDKIFEERIRIRELYNVEALYSTHLQVLGLILKLPKFRKRKKGDDPKLYAEERNSFYDIRRRELSHKVDLKTWKVSTGIDCLQRPTETDPGTHGVVISPNMETSAGKQAKAMLDRLRIYDAADILVQFGVVDPSSVLSKDSLAVDIKTARVKFLRNSDMYFVTVPVEKGMEDAAYLRYPGIRRVLWSDYIKACETDVR